MYKIKIEKIRHENIEDAEYIDWETAIDVREKLVELIGSTEYGNGSLVGNNFQKGFIEKIATHLIANGVTVQEWIPVTENPKRNGCYIVVVNHWVDGKPVEREAYWNGCDWLSCDKKRELTPRVTHWMPMPQPPKGE